MTESSKSGNAAISWRGLVKTETSIFEDQNIQAPRLLIIYFTRAHYQEAKTLL